MMNSRSHYLRPNTKTPSAERLVDRATFAITSAFVHRVIDTTWRVAEALSGSGSSATTELAPRPAINGDRQMRNKDKILKANCIELHDDQGAPRIVLDASRSDGPASIGIYGAKGSAVQLWIDVDDVPRLTVTKDSRTAVTFSLDEHGQPIVCFYGIGGKPMIRLGHWAGESVPSIDVFVNGKTIWTSSAEGSRSGRTQRTSRRPNRKPS